MWTKLSGKFEPTTGDSKTRLLKKLAKYELNDITRNPKEWITDIELLRVYLQKLDIHIDDSEMMTHILLELPEEYQTIV